MEAPLEMIEVVSLSRENQRILSQSSSENNIEYANKQSFMHI